MNLVAFARDRYEDYFRRGLLEAAQRDGVNVRYVGFRRRERRIDLVRGGILERSVSLASTPACLGEFVRSTTDNERTVLFNSAGYNWFWHILYLRRKLPRSVLVFDVYDWLYYDATFPKSWVMRAIDWTYRKRSDAVIVVSPELHRFYPGAFLLDNASHVRATRAEKSRTREVAIVASFDQRLDFALLADLLDRLPDVRFHFHGWVRSDQRRVRARFDSLLERANATYHGAYENAALEGLLSGYRIGLLPYATTNRLNLFVNPEKIYHYLQSGMEVIATPIPQALRMQACIHLAANSIEFANRIESLLDGKELKCPPQTGQRFHWSQRWPELRRHLEQIERR